MSLSLYLLPQRLATPSWDELVAAWREVAPGAPPLAVEPACSVLAAPLHVTVHAGPLAVALDLDRASELGFTEDWIEDFGGHELSSEELAAFARAWLATDLLVTLTFTRAPTDPDIVRRIVVSVATLFDAVVTVADVGLLPGVATGIYTLGQLERLMAMQKAPSHAPEPEPTRAATTCSVTAHELRSADPVRDREIAAQLLGDAARVEARPENIGRFFDNSRRLVGFDVALARGSAEITSSLRKMLDRGVALFVRGNVGGRQRVTVTIDGTFTEIAGGASHDNASGRWFDALGVALALRDADALRALCAYHPGNFEDVGPGTEYFVSFAWGLIGLVTGANNAEEMLEQALAGARQAAGASDWARRIGQPTVGVALAILRRDQARFTERLVEALEGNAAYRRRKSEAERADAVVAFLPLGLTALGHDRGLHIEVASGYLPTWLVSGAVERGPTSEEGHRDMLLRLHREGVAAYGLALAGADLGGRILTGLSLDRVSLRGATLARAVLDNASFREVDLSGADLSRVSARGLRGRHVTLDGANLVAAVLEGATLDEARAEAATFRDANLAQASLVALEAFGADFRGVDATGADFSRARLQGADFRGATLVDVDFGQADLRDADSAERTSRARGSCAPTFVAPSSTEPGSNAPTSRER